MSSAMTNLLIVTVAGDVAFGIRRTPNNNEMKRPLGHNHGLPGSGWGTEVGQKFVRRMGAEINRKPARRR